MKKTKYLSVPEAELISGKANHPAIQYPHSRILQTCVNYDKENRAIAMSRFNGILFSSTNKAIIKSHPCGILFKSINKAYAKSRLSGILFASANSKLYFECLKIFSVPENHLPHMRGEKCSEVAFPK